jgi:hypothetical protein
MVTPVVSKTSGGKFMAGVLATGVVDTSAVVPLGLRISSKICEKTLK